MSKSKGMISRRLRKAALREQSKGLLFVIPATRQEHYDKSDSLWSQAEALFRKG